MKKNIDLINGPINALLLKILYPILICGIFQQLYNILDGIIVGRFLGTDALASIGGSSYVLISIFVSFITGVCTGAIVIVSQSYGSRKTDQINKSIKNSIFIAFCFGLAAFIIYFTFSKNILMILGVPQNIINSSSNYLKIYSIGFLPSALVLMIINLLRATGEAKRPTYFLIGSYVLNIIMDIIFIVFLKLGILGVSFSFIISQSISAVILIIAINDDFELFSTKFHPDLNEIKKILAIGLPSGIVSFFYAFTNLVMQSSVNNLGSNYIAAFAINGKVEMLFYVFATSLGITVTTFVAQNYGANQKEKIITIVNKSLILGFSISCIIITFLFLFRYSLVHIFTTNELVINIGTQLVKFMAPMYLFYLPIEIFTQTLKALGKAIVPTYITLFGVCFIRVVWLTLFANQAKSIIMILASYPISWIITTLLTYIYYLKIRKQVLKA